MNSLKENAFFKMCCTKADTPSCMLISTPRPSRLSPVPRWLTENSLLTDWEVESCPQALLQDQICILTCIGDAEFFFFFWCRLSSARICALRAVSTGVPTKQRQAHIRDPSANTHPRSSRSTGAPCIEKSSWRSDVSLPKSTYFCGDLLMISFQKNIKVVLMSGSLFLKKEKPLSSSMAKTALVLQRPWTTVTYKFVS